MRHAVAALFVALSLSAVRAEGYKPTLTVLLDFEDPSTPAQLGLVKAEVVRLFQPAGVTVDVRLRAEAAGEEFADVALLRVKGSCRSAVDPMLVDERGPAAYAQTYTSDGRALPFGQISCERVRRAVDAALWGGERAAADQYLARALARIVAHELSHMAAGGAAHAKTGVFREALSPKDLVSDNLRFSEADIQRLRRAYRQQKDFASDNSLLP